MNESRVTEWITIATNLAVLAGLILLVIEIRQNNNLAKLEALQERRSLLQQAEMEYFDPENSKVWVKSIMEPENMTLSEIRAMDAFMNVQLLNSGHIWNLGQAGLMSEEEAREWMLYDVNYLFSNTFAQTWWQVWGSDWSHLADFDEAISSVDEIQMKRNFETLQRLLKERASSTEDAD